MKTTGKARTGRKARAVSVRLRTRAVAVLVDQPRISVADMGVELRVSRYRARTLMTAEVRAEADRLRREIEASVGEEHAAEIGLEDVDRAMMKQARLGNVQAARLVYMRMAQKGEGRAVPTLEELEAELWDLKQRQGKGNR